MPGLINDDGGYSFLFCCSDGNVLGQQRLARALFPYEKNSSRSMTVEKCIQDLGGRPSDIAIYLPFQFERIDGFKIVLGAVIIVVDVVGSDGKSFVEIQIDLGCDTELISAFAEVEFAGV
mmetsp:Transcript_322/g.548  ORF Transcript_322/g.548 Transcript_322/m.548 type:complete len:120 (-) Transcript_322:57-416(-)